MLETFDDARLAAAGPRTLSDLLEQGRIVYFPRCPVPLPDEADLDLLRNELARHITRALVRAGHLANAPGRSVGGGGAREGLGDGEDVRRLVVLDELGDRAPEDAVVGAVDRTGRFFYVSNRGSNSIAAFTIDQTTGALTAVSGSPFATQAQPSGITFDPSGKYLYAANGGAASVTAYAINATSGALTVVNTAPAGTIPSFAITYGLQ